MFLAVDIGNSLIKCGLFEHGELVARFSMLSDPSASLAAYRHSLRSHVHDATPTSAGLCSVVPALTEVIGRAIRDDFMLLPTVVGPEIDLPFDLDYHPADSLGADRLCAAAAAYTRYGHDEVGNSRAIIVVDAGTAVTYEVIVDGVYRGGAIAPGPELSADALTGGAARLSRIDVTVPGGPIGNNTVDGIRSGIMLGFLDSVSGMLQRLTEAIGAEPFVVATGGGAEFLASHVPKIDVFEPDLVLEGVAFLAGYKR